MIKQGLQNFIKSLRHFFTPLGTMFLGIMIGLSVAIPDIIAAASTLTDGVKSLAANVNLDFNGLLDSIWTQITSLDWTNPAQALQTLCSTEWLNQVLTQTLQTMLGTDFETFKQQIASLIIDFTARITTDITVFFVFWILGFFAGFAIIKLLIRRDIAKRSIWKFVLAYFINGLLSTAFVVLCLFVFTIWQSSIYISVLSALLLVGTLSLAEAYLLHGYNKVKFGAILNVKNIAFYMITNTIIFLISVALAAAAILINPLMGLFVGLSLTVIAFIVISLNAESYVLSVANTPAASATQIGSVQYNNGDAVDKITTQNVTDVNRQNLEKAETAEDVTNDITDTETTE